MNLDWELIFKRTLTTLIIILSLWVGFGIGRGYIELPTLAKKNIEVSDCNLKTIQESVYCLNVDFNSWFVYNDSNTGIKLTEADLKASGGVCSHASEWYQKHLDSFGFLTRSLSIYSDETTIGHRFLIAYDKKIDNYCLIDQGLVQCFQLKGEEDA